MQILKSASKIAFLLLTLSTCVGMFLGKVSEDNFMLLVLAASSFYFANKGEKKEPYLGK